MFFCVKMGQFFFLHCKSEACLLLRYSTTGGYSFLFFCTQPLHHRISPSNELRSCWFPSKRDDRLVVLRAKKKNPFLFFFFLSVLLLCSCLHQEVWYIKPVKPSVATLLSVREVRQEGNSGCKGDTQHSQARWVSSEYATPHLHFSYFSFLD